MANLLPMKSLRDEIHYVDEVRRWRMKSKANAFGYVIVRRMKSKAKAFGEITAKAISSAKQIYSTLYVDFIEAINVFIKTVIASCSPIPPSDCQSSNLHPNPLVFPLLRIEYIQVNF